LSQQSRAPAGDVAAFAEGVNHLKVAAIIMIAATVLTGVGALASVMTFISSFTSSPVKAITMIFGGVAVAGIVGGILVLAATLHLFKAFNRLRDFSPERFGTTATIVKVGFLAYGLMGVITPIAMCATVSQVVGTTPGFAVMQQVVGTLQTLSVLLFIARAAAMVGVGLGTYHIYSVTDEGLFLGAAILFFISIFVPILALIGWILIIVGAGNAVSKVRAACGGPGREAGEPVAPST